ncbi:MAG: UDP-N-acetylmuramoylalanine--D-glutamate ligase [Candidatus Anoxychlamydiales bacterium]|nr:UDP-N-acetylmuramoylalanine--D-glutamate ligase [Candidatus Anoxychlamydiales bacterium]
MKKYLILGLKKSGIAAAFFALHKKIDIICFDDNLENNSKIENLKNNNVVVTNDISKINLNKICTIIKSPGVSNNHEIIKKAKINNIEIISEIEFGFKYMQNKCIAITGTNGKSSLTTLITHILNENNIQAISLGNIGLPLTQYLINPKEEIVVLELSSFQLENIYSKKVDIACITNIEEDHLDRYDSFLSYANSKLNILKILKNDFLFFTTKKVKDEFNLKKANLCIDDIFDFAKKILKSFKIDFAKAIKTFKNLEHRLELIYDRNEIKIYNDSKSTNINSVIYALKKIKRCDILILGGYDKGNSFTILNKFITNKIRYTIAIGDTRFKIVKELKKNKVEIINNFDIAINRAIMLSKKGDTILFSPGCSSFDMFKNFEHRGDEFKKIVSQILKGEKKL